jgi:hypothetical protein
LHHKLLTRRNDRGALGDFNSLNEMFHRAMIFHPWCALNPAANVNGVGHDRRDRATHVLRV